MVVDYVLVGQGICGTMLSWQLMKAGKKVMVIDEERPYTASRIASGVINPVTGRRIVRTWEIEKLMPFAVQAYRNLETALAIPIIRQCNILDFHPTPQMMLAFAERLETEKEYLRIPDNKANFNDYFSFDFGIGEINPCWLIDLNNLITHWRNYLKSSGALMETCFELAACTIDEAGIQYEGIQAQKIIFCEGAAGFGNPWFHQLPYAPNKGQALVASIPDLPATHIYKQGINMVPWQNGLFWIGSSYEWDFTDTAPSADFRQKTEMQLKKWLKLPYRIEAHVAGERPANMERRPFVGLHPKQPAIGLFNGMGTKGCSLAPYFAHEFTQLLTQQTPLTPAADISRFTRILSR